VSRFALVAEESTKKAAARRAEANALADEEGGLSMDEATHIAPATGGAEHGGLDAAEGPKAGSESPLCASTDAGGVPRRPDLWLARGAPRTLGLLGDGSRREPGPRRDRGAVAGAARPAPRLRRPRRKRSEPPGLPRDCGLMRMAGGAEGVELVRPSARSGATATPTRWSTCVAGSVRPRRAHPRHTGSSRSTWARTAC
jgi:hypothetical protein